MKYTIETDIDLPVARVIELFDSFENLKHWQPGFQGYEHISGTSGQPGAKTKLFYEMRNRKVELIETVTVRDLPREFSGTYEMKGFHNAMTNHFSEPSPGKTKWVSHVEWRFSGFGMKILGALMASGFKKRSQMLMNNFKAFAEKQN